MKWMNVLEISKEYRRADETESEEDNICLLEKIVSELKRIKGEGDDVAESLISSFENLKNNLRNRKFSNIIDFQIEFNIAFNDLYDWADRPVKGVFPLTKRCWLRII